MTSEAPTQRVWTLPPLILHPFSDSNGPSKLVESSRASLMLQGLLPSGELSTEELEKRLLDGRYYELRMLFYVGRDLVRWIEQCLDWSRGQDDLKEHQYQFQSFAAFLVDHPPAAVVEKLRQWGVADYKAIFGRGIALNCLFAEAPARELLADEFIRNYYRYADQLFASYRRARAFTELGPEQFTFVLYASGEYTRMLEREWEES